MEVLRKGYTLIELVIALSIIGLVFSIVSINFSLIDDIKERHMVKTIVRDLDDIKTDSIINRRSVSFQSFSDNNYYNIVEYKGFKTRVLRKVELEKGWRFVNESNIKFSSGGTIEKTSTITIANDKGAIIDFTVGVATAKVNVKRYSK